MSEPPLPMGLISRLRNRLREPDYSEVLRIAWPVLVELLLSSMFSMIDQIMLGHLPDPNESAAAIAAVGVSNQLLFIGYSLVQSLNIGGTAMIARYFGAGKRDRMSHVLKHVILLNFFGLTVPFVVLMQIFARPLMLFMGAEPATMAVGIDYFRIVMVGFLFQSATLSISAALRGTGETRVPMRINLIANFSNVIGNAMLIYGLFFFPRLHATGAAISTAVFQAVALILMIRHITVGRGELHLEKTKERFRFDRRIIGNLVRIGVPASGEQLVLRVGLIIFTRIVYSLGTVIQAAHQTALSILSLSFNPGMAFGIAASAAVGHALGAGKPEQAEARARAASRYGLAVAILMALLFFFAAPQFVRLYNNNENVVIAAADALRIIAFIQPFQAVQLVYAGALRGAGDTFWPMIATTVSLLILRTSLASLFVLVFDWGLPGAWLAVAGDQLVRWSIILWRFRTGRWKTVKIR